MVAAVLTDRKYGRRHSSIYAIHRNRGQYCLAVRGASDHAIDRHPQQSKQVVYWLRLRGVQKHDCAYRAGNDIDRSGQREGSRAILHFEAQSTRGKWAAARTMLLACALVS